MAEPGEYSNGSDDIAGFHRLLQALMRRVEGALTYNQGGPVAERIVPEAPVPGATVAAPELEDLGTFRVSPEALKSIERWIVEPAQADAAGAPLAGLLDDAGFQRLAGRVTADTQ